MGTESSIEITYDYKKLFKQLEKYEKERPNVTRQLMNAMATEIKKQIRAESRRRGYKAKDTNNSKGYDFGYSKNLKSYNGRGFSASIKMMLPAYKYKFVEYGANVMPRHGKYLTFKIGDKWVKVHGFTLQAKPLLHPIAYSVWGTEKGSAIMEKKMQQILDKDLNKRK